MINTSTTSKHLGIILPNTNKALAEALKSASPKDLELLSKGTDLKSVMSTILKQSDNSSSKILLELVKNNPTLKNLGSPSETIKELLNTLSTNNTKESLPIEKKLKNFLLDIKDLKPTELKQKLTNSGVFLESNLKNAQNSPSALKEIITNDLKAILTKAKEEIAKSSHPNQGEVLKNIDKLSLQIDHSQLVSYLSNSSSLYLPFSWDQMQEGNIEIKNGSNNKFYCDINLKLKDYGEVKLKLAIYDKNQLDIHLFSSSDDFKSLVKENIPSLRSALIDISITPRTIRVYEPNTANSKHTAYESQYDSMDDDLKMGFKIKV